MAKISKKSPAPGGRRGSKKYPFDKMEVGDSFYVSEPKTHPGILQQRILGNALQFSAWHHQRKRKFTSQRQKNGVRIWRIE